MNCPYTLVRTGVIDHDDPMDVIRHGHENIHLDVLVPFRQRIPSCRYGPTRIVQPHLPIYYLTKQAFALKRAQC